MNLALCHGGQDGGPPANLALYRWGESDSAATLLKPTGLRGDGVAAIPACLARFARPPPDGSESNRPPQ